MIDTLIVSLATLAKSGFLLKLVGDQTEVESGD